MGRRPRVLIAGGIYHVYNRVSRGEHVFADDAEAERLARRFQETKGRDGFQVLAWCVLSNHYHLAIRMGEVALSRSLRTIDHRTAQSFNGRHRLFGPLWQGRYRSKLVEDSDHLRQLITYIHLNPVAAGLAEDPLDYRWSGHSEVVGRQPGGGLVDVDETLAAFEPTRRAAMGRYRRAMSAGRGFDWLGEEPGRLPWWRVGRPPKKDADELVLDTERPLVGMYGRSTGDPRPQIGLEELLRRGARCLGWPLDDLRSRTRSPEVVTAREVMAWVAVELYGFRVKEVARGLEKYGETASRLVSRAAKRRAEDEAFRELVKSVDASIAGGVHEP